MKQDIKIIYKVTNLINSKVYIGKTERGLEKRKQEHIKFALKINENFYSHFHFSIKKYGIDNFKWEIIDDTSITIQELNNKEKLYIEEYNSTNPLFGYNITIGGSGGDTFSNNPNKHIIIEKMKLWHQQNSKKGIESSSYKHIDINKENEIINTYANLNTPCIKHISKITNVSIHIVKRILNKYKLPILSRYIIQQNLLKDGMIKPSRKHNFTEEDKLKIVNMYKNDKIGAKHIAKHFGFKSDSVIFYLLKELNIPKNTKSEMTTLSNLRRSKKGGLNV
jgi:hypothetical protein